MKEKKSEKIFKNLYQSKCKTFKDGEDFMGIYHVCIAGIHTTCSFIYLVVSKANKTIALIFIISPVFCCT